MLRIDWDAQTTPYVDNAAYITIRTGRSRLYRNVLNGLAVRDPARAARVRQDMDILIRVASENGGEALTAPHIPEMYIVNFGDYQAVIVGSILFTGQSLHGRLIGEFKLLIVMAEEMDACLTEIFKLDKYVEAALSTP